MSVGMILLGASSSVVSTPPILHVVEPDLAELSGQQRHGVEGACQWRLRPRSVNPGEDFDGKENEGMHYTRV